MPYCRSPSLSPAPSPSLLQLNPFFHHVISTLCFSTLSHALSHPSVPTFCYHSPIHTYVSYVCNPDSRPVCAYVHMFMFHEITEFCSLDTYYNTHTHTHTHTFTHLCTYIHIHHIFFFGRSLDNSSSMVRNPPATLMAQTTSTGPIPQVLPYANFPVLYQMPHQGFHGVS